jgi:hypothetical protein
LPSTVRMRSVAALAPALVLALWPVATASAGDTAPARNCVGQDATEARAAGDTVGAPAGTEGAPPTFSAAFYRRTFTLEVSMDGADGRELPVSIEAVCDIPKRDAAQAAQLAGTDAVALLLTGTAVRLAGTTVRGPAAAAAIDGADTATLTVRLARPRLWREDEDGTPVPTFSARRIDITD